MIRQSYDFIASILQPPAGSLNAGVREQRCSCLSGTGGPRFCYTIAYLKIEVRNSK
jgi:hypothetical protein